MKTSIGNFILLLCFIAGILAFFMGTENKNKKAIVVEFTNPLNSVVSVDTFYINAETDGMSIGDQFPMWIILNTCPDNTSLIGDADMEVKNLVDMLEHECSTPHDIQQEIGFKYGEIVAAWIEE